jgi:hypothetical protein
LSLDADQCNIVVLHGQESEYSARDKAEIIHLTALKNKGIDYLAWDTSTAIKKSVWMREASIVIPAVWRAEGLTNAESMDL